MSTYLGEERHKEGGANAIGAVDEAERDQTVGDASRVACRETENIWGGIKMEEF